MSEEEQGGIPEESAETPENNETPVTPDPVDDAVSSPDQAPADVPESSASGDASGDSEMEPDAAAALAAAQAAVADAIGGDLAGAEPGDVAGAQESVEATADDLEAMMAQAMAEEGLGPEGEAGGQPGAQPTGFAMPSFSPSSPAADSAEMQLLGDVNVDVRIELGRTRMLVEDVLRLGEGAVVELEKLAGDPVDVFVNGRHVAKGEVLVLNESFCVRVNEVLEPVTIEAAEDS